MCCKCLKYVREGEREREAGVCFCKHWKCGERDAEGVYGALQCLKYIYIYIYIYNIYIYIYICIQRERERWRGELCGALSLLEVCIYIYSEREREMARRVVWCVVIA